MVVAFVLFTVNSKHRYSTADVAITYVLFTGGLILEGCAIFILLMSPRTWAWLKARSYHRLSRVSFFLLSSKIGRPEGRPLWSNRIGQIQLSDLSGLWYTKDVQDGEESG